MSKADDWARRQYQRSAQIASALLTRIVPTIIRPHYAAAWESSFPREKYIFGSRLDLRERFVVVALVLLFARVIYLRRKKIWFYAQLNGRLLSRRPVIHARFARLNSRVTSSDRRAESSASQGGSR